MQLGNGNMLDVFDCNICVNGFPEQRFRLFIITHT
jgi:hypothetical protein